MIYELALVAEATIGDDRVASLNDLVSNVVKAHEGEVLLADDWGTKKMAQAASNGTDRAHYLYFIYRANSDCNAEIDRLLRIADDVMKQLFIKLGADEEAEAIVKGYKTPFSKKYNGTVTKDETEEGDDEEAGDKRKFTRGRACWFTAKGIKADWKDPATFTWLINEFGKISPARVSGISVKHQRFATTAIKRARQLGLASYMSNRIAE